MTITDTPRARLEAYLKSAKTIQTVAAIAQATGLGESTVANLLNAMRTDNNVKCRKVNKGTSAKPKNVTEYWWTGEGIEPPSASRPPIKPRAKKPEPKKVARSLTHDIVSVMQDHPPETEFRSEAIASMLAIKFPDEPVTRQIVAQRLSTMTGKHIRATQHKLADESKKQPGGRTYYQTYSLINHPAAQAADQAAPDPSDSEGGLTDVKAQQAPLSVAITKEDPAPVEIIPVSHVPHVQASDGAFVAAAAYPSHLDDIRHVAGLPDSLADDQVAEAVRLRIAGMERRIQDMQSQIMAVSIALQEAGSDIENQTAVENINAMRDAITVLNQELARRPCLVAADQKNPIESAVIALQSAIAGTGATLTLRDNSDAVGVLYGRSLMAIARPGDDLKEVINAIRTINNHKAA